MLLLGGSDLFFGTSAVEEINYRIGKPVHGLGRGVKFRPRLAFGSVKSLVAPSSGVEILRGSWVVEILEIVESHHRSRFHGGEGEMLVVIRTVGL